jgi:hypothetical protein
LPGLDPDLQAPWDTVLAPALWPSVDGVELGHEVQRSRKRVERLGEVVRDDIAVVDTAQYLLMDGPIGDLGFDGLDRLRGRPRIKLQVVRPAVRPSSELGDGSIVVDGRAIPYQVVGAPELDDEVAWSVSFRDGDADVTIAGLDLDEVPQAWVRIDARPLRHALLRMLGRA